MGEKENTNRTKSKVLPEKTLSYNTVYTHLRFRFFDVEILDILLKSSRGFIVGIVYTREHCDKVDMSS